MVLFLLLFNSSFLVYIESELIFVNVLGQGPEKIYLEIMEESFFFKTPSNELNRK